MPPISRFATALGLLAALLHAPAALALDTLKIALIPSEDSRAMIKQSQPMLDALGKQLGVKVQGFVATDYNGVIEALRSGHVDVAYLGPFSYVKAAEVAQAEAFAVAETRKAGSVAYHAQIIAGAKTPIRALKDLKGRNFAFVDPTSTSGYVFPMMGLKQAGIDPKRDFANVVYTGAHDANLLAVKNGRVDAATVADRILAEAQAKGMIAAGDYRVVWRSPPIPESPMAWRKSLPAADKARILKAFLALRDLPFGDQGQVNRYVATNDRAYDVVRAAAVQARK